MKTPEGIKKGLELCGVLDGDCENCPYDDGPKLLCVDRLRKDAIAYIQQLENAVEFYSNTTQVLDAKIAKLESRLAQVERERDAAVKDLNESADCNCCKHYNEKMTSESVCFSCDLRARDHFEWRGVCEESTKGE